MRAGCHSTTPLAIACAIGWAWIATPSTATLALASLAWPSAFRAPIRRGGDYPPPLRCAALWRRPLLARLPGVELTLLVGIYAQRWALQHAAKGSMTGTVATWRTYGPSVIPLPHPSWRTTIWLRRNGWFESELAPYIRARVDGILFAEDRPPAPRRGPRLPPQRGSLLTSPDFR
jgi:hypothetical protein